VATIRPFRALRYDEGVAGPLTGLVAPPYDVVTPEEVGRLGNGATVVVVDPIDGSVNAKRGIPPDELAKIVPPARLTGVERRAGRVRPGLLVEAEELGLCLPRNVFRTVARRGTARREIRRTLLDSTRELLPARTARNHDRGARGGRRRECFQRFDAPSARRGIRGSPRRVLPPNPSRAIFGTPKVLFDAPASFEATIDTWSGD